MQFTSLLQTGAVQVKGTNELFTLPNAYRNYHVRKKEKGQAKAEKNESV